MYYERLANIFNGNIHELFPEISIDDFDNFIRKQQLVNGGIISPYKFAMELGITVNASVKFFIFFTGENGILDIIYYFDCSKSSCRNTRIFLDPKSGWGEPIRCVECGNAYFHNTFKTYIKISFNIKPEINIPSDISKIMKLDCNSTYEALKDLPPNLKLESPSYSPDPNEGEEKRVSLNTLLEANVDNNGNPISTTVERFKLRVMELSG